MELHPHSHYATFKYTRIFLQYLAMQHIVAVFLLCIITHQVAIQAKIPRPENFYGSEALLDGYCDEAQNLTDAFTLSSEQRVTVEGSADDVTRQLATINTTGQ